MRDVKSRTRLVVDDGVSRFRLPDVVSGTKGAKVKGDLHGWNCFVARDGFFHRRDERVEIVCISLALVMRSLTERRMELCFLCLCC